MLLQVEHLGKSFGDHRVLDDLNFSVAAGEAVALLGANGAGKTTLLRIVTRLIEPDSGCVRFDGHLLQQDDLRYIGYLPEERGLYRRMRAGEQALYFSRLKGMDKADAEQQLRQWFARLGMEEWWNRPAGKLSKGMQQKLQLAVTVAHRPKLLILDEPFSGLDSENSALLRRELLNLKQAGTAVLLSTHNLQAADELCDKTVKL